MRHFTGFLIFLLTLTACTAPAQSAPTKIAAPEFPAVTLDGTFETSLLASTWSDGPNGSMFFLIDPASGKTLPGYEPISLTYISGQAFSADGKMLAVVDFANHDHYYLYNGSLVLIDLAAWKTRRFDLQLDGWVNTMAFSPDGKRLAIAHGETTYSLTMVDVERGNIIAESQVDSYVTRLKFTANGEALMIYKPSISRGNALSTDPPQVLLLDAESLRPRWSEELEGVRDGMFAKDETITQLELYEPGNALYFTPALTFAPDRDILYIVHPDSEQFTKVDFDIQKIETIKIQPRLSWFERLLSLTAGVAHAKIADGTTKQAVISPDGQFLYVVGVSSRSFQDQLGNFQMEETSLGLEIIQTRDGSRVARVESDADELSLSPDGRFLYLREWGDGIANPRTEIFDTSSRQIVARKEALYATPALLMNGQFLLTSTYVSIEEPYREQYHMSVLQPFDLSIVAEWTGSEFIHWGPP